MQIVHEEDLVGPGAGGVMMMLDAVRFQSGGIEGTDKRILRFLDQAARIGFGVVLDPDSAKAVSSALTGGIEVHGADALSRLKQQGPGNNGQTPFGVDQH